MPARVGSFFLASKPILDPRQDGSQNEEAELIAARRQNENGAANRQTEADADDAFAALDEIDDGSVYRVHGSSLIARRSPEQGGRLENVSKASFSS
jgi:hypothetical protein